MSSGSISVIIPFHNRTEYFEECLNSVLRQTLPPLEIIVVDDGSNQRAHEFLKKFTKHIHIIRHSIAQGPGAARNAGIAAARGDLIAFLDDDDAWERSKLEIQAAYFRDHPDCDAVHTGVTVVYADGRERIFDEKPRTLRIEDVLFESYVIPSSFAIRTSRLRGVGGFDPAFKVAEDTDFLIRLVEHGCRIHFIAQPLIRFRRMGHDRLTGRTLTALRHSVMLVRKHRNLYERVGGPGAARRRVARSMIASGSSGGGVLRRSLVLAGRLLGGTE
jgi:glycosyltransferase involved in cell wall biosynthesis